MPFNRENWEFSLLYELEKITVFYALITFDNIPKFAEISKLS